MISWERGSCRAIPSFRSISLAVMRDRSMARPSRLVTERSSNPTAEIKTTGDTESCISLENDSILNVSVIGLHRRGPAFHENRECPARQAWEVPEMTHLALTFKLDQKQMHEHTFT